MKEDVQLIHDSERIRILLEETRKNILNLLKIEDMSISQLAEGLGKDRSTIYRHVKKLEEYGYVELKGERIVNNVPGMIYGRTAKIFLPCPRSMEPSDPILESLNWEEENAVQILGCLKTLGYDFEISDKMIDDICNFFSDIDEKMVEIMKEEGLVDMGFLETLKLKILIILIEFCNNEEVHDEVKKLISDFEPPA